MTLTKDQTSSCGGGTKNPTDNGVGSFMFTIPNVLGPVELAPSVLIVGMKSDRVPAIQPRLVSAAVSPNTPQCIELPAG